MSEKTKTEIIEEILRERKIEPTPQEIKEIAEQQGCSKALVYKVMRKLRQEGFYGEIPSEETEAKEPILKIGEPTEIPIEEEKPEIPSEFLQPTEAEAIPTQPTLEQETAPQLPIQPIGMKTEDLEWMFKWSFEKIADFTEFEGWRLKDEEAQKLAEAWTPLINQNMGTFAKYTPYITAFLTTFIVLAPRIIAYRKYKAEQKAKEETEEHEIAQKIPEEQPKEEEIDLETKKMKEASKFQKKLAKIS